jgi:hypothetical protein
MTINLNDGENDMRVFLTLLATSLLFSSAAWAQRNSDGGTRTYEVKVTNITKGVIFTPLLAATHTKAVSFFKLGQPANDALEQLAEGGAIGPLEMWLHHHSDDVLDTATNGGLLFPGETVTFEIEGNNQFNYFSMAGMLLPTNDSFVAMNSMPLPKKSGGRFALGFDSGTEDNDENCLNIPGPQCAMINGFMGDGYVEGGGEGYVFISNGIHGNGDLSDDAYDWRNPVARVTLTWIEETEEE